LSALGTAAAPLLTARQTTALALLTARQTAALTLLTARQTAALALLPATLSLLTAWQAAGRRRGETALRTADWRRRRARTDQCGGSDD
jgi:hypothetical protein